jgi:hypothetical protein
MASLMNMNEVAHVQTITLAIAREMNALLVVVDFPLLIQDGAL